MNIDRTTIIQGPALVTHLGQKFWTKGDVVVRPVQKRFTVDTAAHGKLQDRNIDLRIEVTFEPAGQFTDALAAVLWPYASTYPGTSIYGATDEELIIYGRDGVSVTLANARLTKLPNLRFGVAKTTIGALTYTGLVSNSADPAAIASYWAWASTTYPGDTGFSMAEIFTAGIDCVWGAVTGFDSFLTEAGVEVAFNLRLAEVAVDGIGTVDMKFVGLDVTATAIPVGPTAAQAMAALHASLAPGAAPTSAVLGIYPSIAGAPEFEMTAMLASAELGYGTNRKRVGSCTWNAVRTFTAYDAGPPAVPAAMAPLFSVAEYAE